MLIALADSILSILNYNEQWEKRILFQIKLLSHHKLTEERVFRAGHCREGILERVLAVGANVKWQKYSGLTENWVQISALLETKSPGKSHLTILSLRFHIYHIMM